MRKRLLLFLIALILMAISLAQYREKDVKTSLDEIKASNIGRINLLNITIIERGSKEDDHINGSVIHLYGEFLGYCSDAFTYNISGSTIDVYILEDWTVDVLFNRTPRRVKTVAGETVTLMCPLVLFGGELVIELEEIPENLTINVWLDDYRDKKVELRLYERWHLKNGSVQRGAYPPVKGIRTLSIEQVRSLIKKHGLFNIENQKR
ncbi:hypothetical protein VFC49_09690 [Thermococcus sp. SY098]|uniref:hypothetical protein n=1 Tax=Thermococcus sp. SY098 TaxID=3111325 RepID=UPI002D777484|nr:hypothetical protein [Thermococcus sp. SY098]WRS52310.1 hypothetical protein VFC49_09690 [Thermococcus sp. SY098]